MKKIIVGLIASVAGLLIVCSVVAMMLGMIYAVSYNPIWICLWLAPLPMCVAARLLMKWVYKIIGFVD